MWRRCPIQSSLGALGRAWTLLILRDIAFCDKMRFSDILGNNPGLSHRVLSMRLRDLQEEGLIKREANPSNRREAYYSLTSKGNDVVPVLTAYIQYGAVHRARDVFEDGRPRGVERLFPNDQEFMLGPLRSYAAPSPKPPRDAR